MLNEDQIKEIREHLERAQNPIFFYDNDADGLCSFLILRRYIDRGKGVAIRSFPDLNKQYARKASELKADYVFILDKPILSGEFVKEIQDLGLPIVWIDHHLMEQEDDFSKYDNFFVYNPMRNSEKEQSSEPVTYLSYKVSGKKEDMWLALAGCISDHYLPDFAEDFGKENPDLWGKVKTPFDAYYGTEFGNVIKALNFGLKDSTSNIVRFQNYLITCNHPQEVLAEVPGNYPFRKRYVQIKKKYDALLEKARKSFLDGIVFFIYGGDLSISSDLSNELFYIFKNKYVVVAYNKGAVVNLSLRGKNVKGILSNILEKIENSSGGGHDDAVGARIPSDKLDDFKKYFLEEIK